MIETQKLEIFIVGHTANLEEANKLAKQIKSFPNAPKNIQIIELGPSVGTHLGPGGLLLAWLGDFDKKLLVL
ncbi:MAG: hypothetical protein ACFFDW_11025 [Candidatus Thorarchaeota archaeon]